MYQKIKQSISTLLLLALALGFLPSTTFAEDSYAEQAFQAMEAQQRRLGNVVINHDFEWLDDQGEPRGWENGKVYDASHLNGKKSMWLVDNNEPTSDYLEIPDFTLPYKLVGYAMTNAYVRTYVKIYLYDQNKELIKTIPTGFRRLNKNWQRLTFTNLNFENAKYVKLQLLPVGAVNDEANSVYWDNLSLEVDKYALRLKAEQDAARVRVVVPEEVKSLVEALNEDGENLITNPNFDNGFEGWIGNSPKVETLTDANGQQNNVLMFEQGAENSRITRSRTQVSYYYTYAKTKNFIPVDNSKRYHASLWLADDNVDNKVFASIYVEFFDRNRHKIDKSKVYLYSNRSTIEHSGKRYGVSFQPPQNAAFVQLNIQYRRETKLAHKLYVDDVSLYEITREPTSSDIQNSQSILSDAQKRRELEEKKKATDLLTLKSQKELQKIADASQAQSAFSQVDEYSFPSNDVQVFSADFFNQDGYPEILTVNRDYVSVYANNNGLIQKPVNYYLSDFGCHLCKIDSIAIGDLNADNNPDIVYHARDRVFILTSDGTSKFEKTRSVDFANKSRKMFITDFNRDGQPDIIPVYFDAAGNSYYSVIYNENGNFRLDPSPPRYIVKVFESIENLILTDVNDDDYPDFLVVSLDRFRRFWELKVFLNTRKGDIENFANYPLTIRSNQILESDFDTDDSTDLFVHSKGSINNNSYFTAFKNNRNGRFSEIINQTFSGQHFIPFYSADLNGDGYDDALAYDELGVKVLFFDSENQKFAEPINVAINNILNNTYGWFAEDFNKDGMLDIGYLDGRQLRVRVSK